MLLDALQEMLGPNGVLTAEGDTAAYVEDWRGRYRGTAVCVALPSNTEQVARIVRLAKRAGVPVLAQGGNTSLCGGAVPAESGPAPVIVNLQRMRKIRAIDPANNAIAADAGCVVAAIQDHAARHDRLFAVSFGAEGSAQLGGAIATNAGGTGVLRYGNMRDNILGLEVVLPDGSIWDGLYALRKNNTGYDLKHLFIGSEGTLGIVTAASLKLHPLPTARSVAWLGVRDPEAALRLLGLFRASCNARLSAFELIDANQVGIVVAHAPGRRCPLENTSCWHVLVELSDTVDEVELDHAMQGVLERALELSLVHDAVVGTSEGQRNAMWEFRHSVSEANKKAGIGLTTDCAVPISAVPAFIARATDEVRAIVPDLPIVVVSHLGDGNVHFIPFFRFEAWAAISERETFAERIKSAVNSVAHALGGTFSAEHGIGRTLVGDMTRYKPPIELMLMRAIKQTLDPSDLFNPGRLLPPIAAEQAAVRSDTPVG